jgi:hypothetical protein
MIAPEITYKDSHAELWLGDCLIDAHVATVMGGRVADLLAVDAPYSEKTHSGHSAGKVTAERAASFGIAHENDPTPESLYARRGGSGRRDIDYAPWSREEIRAFVDLWHPRCSGWMISITDDVLAQDWRAEMGARDRFAFPGIPLVETGSRCRLGGDGPSPWTVWVMVARPRTAAFAKWGTLPGAYVQPAERDFNSTDGSDRVVGGKPVRSMCGIVGDYSRRDALVVDPCCGGGTCGIAAKMLGRRFIGMDTSVERLAIAAKRIAKVREQLSLLEAAP